MAQRKPKLIVAAPRDDGTVELIESDELLRRNLERASKIGPPHQGLKELIERHRNGLDVSDRAVVREANYILLAHKTFDREGDVSVPPELFELLITKLVARGLKWAAGRAKKEHDKGMKNEAAWAPLAKELRRRHPDWSKRRIAQEIVRQHPTLKIDTVRKKLA